MATIGQPYMGCWNVSDNDTNIGVVSGDCAIGFVARDQDDQVLGHYPTYERALYAVLHTQALDCQTRRRELVTAH